MAPRLARESPKAASGTPGAQPQAAGLPACESIKGLTDFGGGIIALFTPLSTREGEHQATKRERRDGRGSTPEAGTLLSD